jgi:putative endopeptidase
MTPQTVNAYYQPTANEIVFPAAYLQPPFFDPTADPAVNYGAVGATIGHEIGHGFDDEGSPLRRDRRAQGLVDRGGPQDLRCAAPKLAAQYDKVCPSMTGKACTSTAS